MAENQQCEEVVKLSRNLNSIRDTYRAQLYRCYHNEEISYLEKYLYCMKIRYQSSQSYELDISEDIGEEKIPKLIIHRWLRTHLNMVQIAIRHGDRVLGRSVVSAAGEPGWIIEVIDHGLVFQKKYLNSLSCAREN